MPGGLRARRRGSRHDAAKKWACLRHVAVPPTAGGCRYRSEVDHVRGAKGKKDRYIIWADSMTAAYDEYLRRYVPRGYIFEVEGDGRPYSIRSAEEVFGRAIRRADIDKEVSIHSLRHAFATHLLEQGVDHRYIQELLGHASSKTTEIYTHVSRRELGRIKSPLDGMMGEV